MLHGPDTAGRSAMLGGSRDEASYDRRSLTPTTRMPPQWRPAGRRASVHQPGCRVMAAASLQAVVEALGALERRDLEEIALAYVRTHAQVCRLAAGTDHVEEQHATDAELAQRIGEMSDQQLAELLGPAAWLSVIAHEQRP